MSRRGTVPAGTAGERQRHRATHGEPRRAAFGAPEVFPYGQPDAGFSLTTAAAGHALIAARARRR